MTAAQALGHTKNPEAASIFVPLFDDPNEVVACHALSCFQEVNANEFRRRQSLSPAANPSPPSYAAGDKRCVARAARGNCGASFRSNSLIEP